MVACKPHKGQDRVWTMVVHATQQKQKARGSTMTTTAKTTKATATVAAKVQDKVKVDYLTAHKIQPVYYMGDAIAPNKQVMAVALCLLGKAMGVPNVALVAIMARNGAGYVNGKQALTVDAATNGNGIYVRHAAQGLADSASRHAQWVNASIGKLAAGAMSARDGVAVKYALQGIAQASKVDKATIADKVSAMAKTDKAMQALLVACKAA